MVNALWHGGAEAMMLQDQRVISTSAVRCVGNTLILQGRVYSPPYRISAIGDVTGMRSRARVVAGRQIYKEFAHVFGLAGRRGPGGSPSGVHRHPRPAYAGQPGPRRPHAPRPSAHRAAVAATRPAPRRRAPTRRATIAMRPPTAREVTLHDPHPRRRQLRQLRLDHRRLPRTARRRVRRPAQRRGDPGRRRRLTTGCCSPPGPGRPRRPGCPWHGRGLRATRPSRCSASASATRPWARCSAARSPARPSSCTARPPVVRHDGSGVLDGLPVAVHRHALPLAGGRPRHGARRAAS